jgi:8-oxo-dGTP pyrophosphatase MutT (NUDIX family)
VWCYNEKMIIRKQFPKFLAPNCIAFEKSVGAVVFRITNGQREYLLMKYRNGHWEFPRGKVEDGETEIDTMRREIEEETGISQLRIIEGYRKNIRFSYKAHGDEYRERAKDKNCAFIRKKAVFYLAEAMDEDVVISHEHQKFLWLTFDEAMNRLTFSNAKKILEAANKYLQKHCVNKLL